MLNIFTLLVIYQLKHFICDYLLQNRYMLGKFKLGKEWILPLTAHSLVHAIATVSISLFYVSTTIAVLLGIFDFTTHFIIDRIKASPNILGRFKATEKEFWWALGADQMSHHFVHYLIIFVLLGV